MSQWKIPVTTLLVVITVVWADVHFLLAVFRAGRWWDVIPLIGMGIISYGMIWFARRVWHIRDQLDLFSNLLHNIATVMSAAETHPRGYQFIAP
jgi:hypothetical protein